MNSGKPGTSSRVSQFITFIPTPPMRHAIAPRRPQGTKARACLPLRPTVNNPPRPLNIYQSWAKARVGRAQQLVLSAATFFFLLCCACGKPWISSMRSARFKLLCRG